MLDLFGGILSFFLGGTPPAVAKPVAWDLVINPSLVETIVTAEPDPIATAVMQQHLEALMAQGFDPNGQAIWIRTDEQVMAEHLGTTPLPAASLTKIPTTLVALATWGPEHQFETIVGTNGVIQNGVLQGDLILQGASDPFFVWEEAIVLGNALNQLGITQVTGDLVIAGDFLMNFEPEPLTAGALLQQGLDADRWSSEASTQFQQLPPGTARPQVRIAGTVRLASEADLTAFTPLIRHQSLPLVNILKGMNIYSNNIIADKLAETLGGADSVAKQAAELANVPSDEIQMINGSGLGEANRLSPRAVTAMLTTLQRYLSSYQITIADLFPITGQDGGTMNGRRIPSGAVLKTGTLDAVSSLAGVIPTRDRGLVWFAVINLGAGDIGIFHDEQDRLLQRLEQAWGVPDPLPPSITPSRQWQESYRLGAAERNQIP